MANVKITELPSADALTGTEETEVVQGGVSKRTTLSAHPISTATASALSGKSATGHNHDGVYDPAGTAAAAITAARGAADGLAPLGSDSKVPAAYLPSYVDDVLEYADFASLPGTGETGKIYIAMDTGAQYRWSGSAYVQLVGSPGSTDAVPEGSVNKYLSAANLATVAHAATSKTPPVDADELSLIDSAASYGLKKLTWANLKATLWSSLGALIAGGTEKSTPVDADTVVISDSADSAATKKLSITSLWVNYLKAKADALYPTLTTTNSFRDSQTLLSETGAAITLNIYGDGSGANILNRRYSNDISGCTYTVAKARGSYASPSPVNAGDITGSVAFQGYGGSNFRSIATIVGMVEAYVSDTNISGYLSFRTNAGSTGVTERARLKSNGDFVLTSSGLLGYDAGSGGAVTQATSRTTGVTLNTSNGAITLVSAAGSTTFASFTVTNSLVAATDCVIVNQKSGTDLYEIHVTNVAAGSFKISYRTISGSTTEQPVFNFAVINGVTS